MQKKIKILYVLDVLSHNSGVSAVVMSYIRNIDREIFDIDVVVHKPSDSDLVREVQAIGFNVIQLPDITLRGFLGFKNGFENLLRNKTYDIVHGHVSNSAFLYLKTAEKLGVKNRIIHAHNPTSADQPLKRVRNDFLERNITDWANHFFACSELAASHLLKSSPDKVVIIPNAIDSERFRYNPEIRKGYRQQLNLAPDTVLIGHVGRMDPQKNHSFLIDVFSEYQKLNPNSKLMLIGQGSQQKSIQRKVEKLKLPQNVLFMGKRGDVANLYQAMDAFVLPSNFEGFGIVGVEAQSAGLPCFFSHNVPKSIAFTENVSYLPIKPKSYAISWAKNIDDALADFERKDQTELTQQTDFEIKTLIKTLQQRYINMM